MPKLIRTLTPDLVSVLQGRTLTFETDDGEGVQIRPMTADEYEAWLRENASGPDDPPMPLLGFGEGHISGLVHDSI